MKAVRKACAIFLNFLFDTQCRTELALIVGDQQREADSATQLGHTTFGCWHLWDAANRGAHVGSKSTRREGGQMVYGGLSVPFRFKRSLPQATCQISRPLLLKEIGLARFAVQFSWHSPLDVCSLPILSLYVRIATETS